MTEFEKFYGKVWETGCTLVITLPKQLQDGLGLKKGDMLKVMLRKEVKKE